MKISIDDIKIAKNGALQVNFEDKIKEIDTDGPVCAEIIFSTYSNFINAKGKIVANVKLECDKCLKEFLQRIETEVDETYALKGINDGLLGEIELKEGDFITDLNGEREIDVDDLIYQSVILDIPNPSVCDINCNGNSELEKYLKKEEADPRLDVFKKINLKDK